MKKQITVILGVVTFTTLSLLVAFPDQVMQWFSPTEESITLYGEVQQPLLAEELSEISDIPEIVDGILDELPINEPSPQTMDLPTDEPIPDPTEVADLLDKASPAPAAGGEGADDEGTDEGDLSAEIIESSEQLTPFSTLTGTDLFITTWNTRDLSTGSTDEYTIKIPTYQAEYSGQIDWGDASAVETFNGTAPILQHTYTLPGIYQISIKGNFPKIFFYNTGDRNKIASVDQRGDIQWTSMLYAFNGCENLQILATDTPDLSKVKDMCLMFYKATNFTGDLSAWDTSNVTQMCSLFRETNFNGDISNWDTSNVENMSRMFQNNPFFNQPIGNWNTSKVARMDGLFAGASGFNQDISNWDTRSAINMQRMFDGTSSFNQDLDDWDVSKVTTMEYMFRGATSFNGSLSGRQTDSLTGIGMRAMFQNASSFNQPLNHFKTDNLTTLQSTFNGASSFNQDLDDWDVSEVTDMYFLFHGARNFNQNLDSWDVSNVTTMREMFQYATNFNGSLSGRNTVNITGNGLYATFRGATSFNQPINHFKTQNVTNMSSMFQGASSFNQDISNWDVSNVATMREMFLDAIHFNQSLNTWTTTSLTGIGLYGTFQNATLFTSDLDNWNVENVESMYSLFRGTNFNGNISNWDVNKVTNMSHMFDGTKAFNQDISNWNIGHKVGMEEMFYGASSFNQDLSSRTITGVNDMKDIFTRAGLSTYNYNMILDSRSQQDVYTGLDFGVSPTQYGGCNISNRENGIAGHQKLIDEKERIITDGGLADCVPLPPATPSSNGGGGGSSLKQDICPDGDLSPSYYDRICETTSNDAVGTGLALSDEEKKNTLSDEEKEHNVADDMLEDKARLVPTDNEIYQRAKASGLTSMPTLETFRPAAPITRAEMAKVVVAYAARHSEDDPTRSKGEEDVSRTHYGKEISGENSFDILDSSFQPLASAQNDKCTAFSDLHIAPLDLQPFIVQACQLGLMGLQADGKTPKKAFTPNETINLAEVATIVSRLFRGETYKGTEQRRYQNHLLALQKADIIPFGVEPMKEETRREVFTILQKYIVE